MVGVAKARDPSGRSAIDQGQVDIQLGPIQKGKEPQEAQKAQEKRLFLCLLCFLWFLPPLLPTADAGGMKDVVVV
jgi:hypothetical protein